MTSTNFYGIEESVLSFQSRLASLALHPNTYFYSKKEKNYYRWDSTSEYGVHNVVVVKRKSIFPSTQIDQQLLAMEIQKKLKLSWKSEHKAAYLIFCSIIFWLFNGSAAIFLKCGAPPGNLGHSEMDITTIQTWGKKLLKEISSKTKFECYAWRDRLQNAIPWKTI